MTGLRLAFLGTPDFAVPSLLAVADAGHEIACVYTQPPRPAGRGHKETPSPVHRLAQDQGWAVRTPPSLDDGQVQADFAGLALDVAVVVAYGLILPKPILAAPRLGCLNVHASLLPRWRGAAPIQRAILAGDRESGVTIMQIDEGLDTGPLLLQEAVPIGPEATAAELHDTLAALGARLIVRTLADLAGGRLAPVPQDDAAATYAAKLSRAEGWLDWRRPAADLARQVRALTPWPGAFAVLPGDGGQLKVLAAEVVDRAAAAEPGALLDGSMTVACGEAALHLVRVQRPGKQPMDGAALLRGLRLPPDTVLPAP